MTIIQRASAPDEAAWPKLKILLPTGLLMGLLLGIVAAQIRSLTTGRVRRADLERRLESPIYGTIRIPINTRPLATTGSRKGNGSNGSNGSEN
jgi:capsular polysaccharide biosynthesis protein